MQRRSAGVSSIGWLGVVTALFLTFPVAAFAQHDHRPPAAPLGQVHFATTCKATVSGMFDRGVALLHDFAFDAAADAFRLVAHSDVDCAMAFWGTAMSRWGAWQVNGSASAVDAGARALAAARHTRHATPRERQYLAAVAQLYEAAGRGGGHAAYAHDMVALSDAYPEDADAALFAALALLQGPEPGVAGQPNRRRAVAILDRVAARLDHPAVPHYRLIAAPSLMPDTHLLETATAFARTAPPTAYGLHLPSHAFVRLGSWDAAVEANLRAADAARRDGLSGDELHALDSLVYALLQSGRDRQAATIARRVTGTALTGAGIRTDEARLAVAAIPARVALERGDWVTAAALPAGDTPSPATALTRRARALGAARRADAATARRELQFAGAASTGIPEGLDDVVTGWILFAEGRRDEAARTLERAVRTQEASGPTDLAFGTLVPPREALGEMFAEMGRQDDALRAFAAALVEAPNRLRSLYGAATAAAKLGQDEVARTHFARIAELSEHADEPLQPWIVEARTKRGPRP